MRARARRGRQTCSPHTRMGESSSLPSCALHMQPGAHTPRCPRTLRQKLRNCVCWASCSSVGRAACSNWQAVCRTRATCAATAVLAATRPRLVASMAAFCGRWQAPRQAQCVGRWLAVLAAGREAGNRAPAGGCWSPPAPKGSSQRPRHLQQWLPRALCWLVATQHSRTAAQPRPSPGLLCRRCQARGP